MVETKSIDTYDVAALYLLFFSAIHLVEGIITECIKSFEQLLS